MAEGQHVGLANHVSVWPFFWAILVSVSLFAACVLAAIWHDRNR